MPSGDRDEVVDFGGGCLDFGGCLVVERHKLLLGCVPLSGRGGIFRQKKPFDLNQKAYHMSSDLQEI